MKGKVCLLKTSDHPPRGVNVGHFWRVTTTAVATPRTNEWELVYQALCQNHQETEASCYETPTERPPVHTCHFVSSPQQPYGSCPKSHIVMKYVRLHHIPRCQQRELSLQLRSSRLNQTQIPNSVRLTTARSGSEHTHTRTRTHTRTHHKAKSTIKKLTA